MAGIDKYKRDAREWRMKAEQTFLAALSLFDDRPFLWFSAALLGHHALEMLIKSALIREGCPVQKGDPEDGVAWGHDLEKLAKLLASKRQDLSLQIAPHPEMPLLSQANYLARYDAFFNELRYPSASPNIDYLGPGEDEAELLTELMNAIRPFAFPVSDEDLSILRLG